MTAPGGSDAASHRAALIAWSAIAEPADLAAGELVTALGPEQALEWVRRAETDLVAAASSLQGHATREVAELAVRGHERWSQRLGATDDPHERRAALVGATVITRGEPGWPTALADLGASEPFALYVRGDADLEAAFAAGVAVVGARSATAYGQHVAAEIAGGVAATGRAVLSGGAYGIDAAAHRAALAAGAATVAVMAGGIDRLYPVGNDELLRAAIGQGAVVSEVPPGYAPHRSRFLSRNRLIATARVTVVVEAALRSGALSTARHAAGLLRAVAAVPGPVTSASSAGCHALIRDGAAVLVSGADEVLELAETASEWLARDTTDVLGGSASAGGGVVAQEGSAPREPIDFESPSERSVYDATSRQARPIEHIASKAGLAWSDAVAAAGRLEMRGLIERRAGGWRRDHPSS